MNDEILHRIEHKLDEIISYLRNSSLAKQGDREALSAIPSATMRGQAESIS
jgi:hypothetical protein